MIKKLAGLLAGECTPSEELALRRHLGDCPGCAGELEKLESVDGLLDLLEPESPPPGLLNLVMESVEKASANKRRAGRQRPAYRPAGLIKDITVAAAAALAVFWLGGNLCGPVTTSTQGRISGAVTSYMQYTEAAVSLTSQAVSEINSDLFSTAEKLNPAKYETGK